MSLCQLLDWYLFETESFDPVDLSDLNQFVRLLVTVDCVSADLKRLSSGSLA